MFRRLSGSEYLNLPENRVNACFTLILKHYMNYTRFVKVNRMHLVLVETRGRATEKILLMLNVNYASHS